MPASPGSICPPAWDSAISRLSSSGEPPRAAGAHVDAEQAQDPVGDGGERDDERTEQHAERLQRARDAPGDRLGAVDRVELRHHLAGDQLRRGDDQRTRARPRSRPRRRALSVSPSSAFEDDASAGAPSAPMPIEVIVTPICTAEMYSLMFASCCSASAAPRRPRRASLPAARGASARARTRRSRRTR